MSTPFLRVYGFPVSTLNLGPDGQNVWLEGVWVVVSTDYDSVKVEIEICHYDFNWLGSST